MSDEPPSGIGGPGPPDWPVDADLTFALGLADLADRVALAGHLRAGRLQTQTKPDRSPVTSLDREVELALRERILAGRPDDAIVGEEFGVGGAQPGAGRWILDPIDGTRNLLRGIPVFATLIALERGSTLQLGICSAPALRRRWWAGRGGGAFFSDGHLRTRPDPEARPWQQAGSRIRVSQVTGLPAALLCHSDLAAWRRYGLQRRFLALAHRCWRTRGFGDFWGPMLVAEGAADIAVEAEPVALWDLAALRVIVVEAGGSLTTLDGRPDITGGGPIVVSNGLLHQQVLEVLAPV